MKQCLNCNNEIDDKKKFCNSSCAAKYNNSHRILSEETKSKISKSLKGREVKFIETENVKSGRLRAGAKRREAALEQLMKRDFNDLSLVRKKKRVRIEQENKCFRCGLNEWMNEPLILEVDHIDGDNTNNIRENLRALCPNCHSQTDTWRGTNSRKVKISDDDLVSILKESKSIRDAILKAGMSITSHSYKRINLLIEKYHINFLLRVKEV
ncbi:hypothetical protein [Yersinia phage fHe-Yen9-04]|uniref:HNH nuclease domain-containing protein n=2 Tax=Eneladusvirus Yen904 TaxID=2560849 RepID=A0A2C9CXY7_9CAUD|nr:HNH endonuclease [Yersinia phage fHe-Yen9-04]SOK58713.1 hypothetical protein [Yersinia phage fHe-Yen9-04]SOK59248.1 hypothetical protein [Yersinia phage fHe-Yen9-03]VUE36482.1 hypothetical protein [Yersinia phage fHe-Yen9-04]